MLKILGMAAALTLVPTVASAQAMSSRTYVAKAGASDLYERQSSQLVADSRDPRVRSFAQTMLRDHAKSTADVKAATRRSGITPRPPVLDAMQRRNIAQLRAARGPERDRRYIRQQQVAHQQALATHRGYAANGAAPALRRTADRIVPVVQHHIDMLARM
jgi:putative membrane protein